MCNLQLKGHLLLFWEILFAFLAWSARCWSRQPLYYFREYYRNLVKYHGNCVACVEFYGHAQWQFTLSLVSLEVWGAGWGGGGGWKLYVFPESLMQCSVRCRADALARCHAIDAASFIQRSSNIQRIGRPSKPVLVMHDSVGSDVN